MSALVVLAALLFRAYIPVGFMPAAARRSGWNSVPRSGCLSLHTICTTTIRTIMRIFKIVPSAARPLKGRFPTC